MFNKKLGVDLGTINVLICEQGRIILQEPALVVLPIEEEPATIVEIGHPALGMLGRTDEEQLQILRPLQGGVIADYEVAEAMLRHFFSTVGRGYLGMFRPEVVISVPYGATSVEKHAVYEAVRQAGAQKVYMIPTPLAAALGVGIPCPYPSR